MHDCCVIRGYINLFRETTATTASVGQSETTEWPFSCSQVATRAPKRGRRPPSARHGRALRHRRRPYPAPVHQSTAVYTPAILDLG